MIKAIVVEDEQYSAQLLVSLLEKHCPDVTVVATCLDPRDAERLIILHQPELIFLDVEMPHLNGFELLSGIKVKNFDVIFTTSYDQYAIMAIRYSALDYLLKPIDPEELKAAVKKFSQKNNQQVSLQLEVLLNRLQHPASATNRIALPTMEGLQVIPVADIIFCSSSSNYTILVLRNKEKLTVSRTLKEIEEMLAEHAFMRVHHSYLVNMQEVTRYIRGEGGSLVMSDGSQVDVSRSKKELLLQKLLPRK